MLKNVLELCKKCVDKRWKTFYSAHSAPKTKLSAHSSYSLQNFSAFSASLAKFSAYIRSHLETGTRLYSEVMLSCIPSEKTFKAQSPSSTQTSHLFRLCPPPRFAVINGRVGGRGGIMLKYINIFLGINV